MNVGAAVGSHEGEVEDSLGCELDMMQNMRAKERMDILKGESNE